VSQFQSTLIRQVRSFAGQLTSLAKALAPNHLKKGISSSASEKANGEFRITLTARGKDAGAWEYGSGLHRQKGTRAEYPIFPKTKRALAFYENANGTWDYDMVEPPMPRVYAPDGRGVFFGVLHPGIRAANDEKGYLRPAVREFRKVIKSKELTGELKRAILGDIKRAFEEGRRG
jgi:hypothetical protein